MVKLVQPAGAGRVINEALGINDYELTGWFGILVPSKTPADVVARERAKRDEALRVAEDLAARAAALGGAGA
ncbi:MAG: hypothetical protein ACO3VG_00960 [Nitriliruptoraceae bacterium]